MASLDGNSEGNTTPTSENSQTREELIQALEASGKRHEEQYAIFIDTMRCNGIAVIPQADGTFITIEDGENPTQVNTAPPTYNQVPPPQSYGNPTGSAHSRPPVTRAIPHAQYTQHTYGQAPQFGQNQFGLVTSQASQHGPVSSQAPQHGRNQFAPNPVVSQVQFSQQTVGPTSSVDPSQYPQYPPGFEPHHQALRPQFPYSSASLPQTAPLNRFHEIPYQPTFYGSHSYNANPTFIPPDNRDYGRVYPHQDARTTIPSTDVPPTVTPPVNANMGARTGSLNIPTDPHVALLTEQMKLVLEKLGTNKSGSSQRTLAKWYLFLPSSECPR